MQIFTTNSISTLRRTLTSTAKNLKHLPASVKTIAQRAIATKSIVGHKGARYRALMVFIVLFGFTISVFGQADFTVTPSARTATVGEVFNLTVVITTSEAANAGEVHMTFDEEILKVNSITTTGPFNFPINPSFNNLNGTIDYQAGTIGVPVNGTFDFLVIEVEAIANGVALLDFNGEDPSKITSGVNPGTVILDSATGAEITVGSVNQPPVFVNNLNNQTNNEQDIVVALDASATDPDGNAISYEATNLPAGLSIDANGFISGTIDLGASNGGSLNTGVYAVVITATDDGVSPLSVSQNFQWTVTTPSVPTYTITASAGDNGSIDPLTATVNEGSDQTFNFTPDAGFEVSEVLVNGTAVSPVPNASYTITNVTSATNISVSFSEIVTGPFQLCIASGNNDLNAYGRAFVGDPNTAPPTGLGFTRTNGKAFGNGTAVVTGTAPGSGEETLFRQEIYGGNTGTTGANPSYNYDIPVANGFYQVDLYFAEVYGPITNAGQRVFDVILEGSPILDEYDLLDPIKDGLPNKLTAIIRTYNVEVTDGSLSLQMGPASVDNGKLSGICVTEAPGANLHPVTAIGDLTYDALVAVADPINIVDPENDELNIVFNGLPASLSYDPTTNQIQGTPLATDANTYTINAIISDGTNSPVTEEFTLVINPVVGDNPPTIDAIADVEVNEGELLSQAIMVTDDNLPAATIELFDVSAGGANNPFTPTTAVDVGTLVDNSGGSYAFNWTPVVGTGRSYLARVTADDGVNAPVTEEFRINVAQQLPGTILARTFNNPVPWYGSSTPDASNGYSVAIETSPAQNIGYIDNGDFVEYLINVPAAGVYDLEVFAGKGNGGTTVVTFSEENAGGFATIGSVNVIQTGWQSYASYKTQVTFTNAGVQTLRFEFNGGANIRDFNFKIPTSNNAPVVEISAPTDGIALTTGTSLDFIGSVTDVEDDDATLTAALNWSSNLDGPLGTGGNISFALTTVGTHTITAEVTDLDTTAPLTGTATITLVVTETDPSCDARFRVNAGGPVLIANSLDFEEDQAAAAGNAGSSAVAGTPSGFVSITAPAVDKTFGSLTPLVENNTGYPDFLFQTERYSDAANPDNMKWSFPTGNGVYDVKILFNENWENENASVTNNRIFDVIIEGDIVLDDYRPSGPTGADFNIAKVEIFQATVTDGILNIDFEKINQNPSVKGFDICFVSDLPTDTPPVLSISSPTDNLTPISIDRLVSTTFTATVEDAEDDNTTLNNALVWSIDPIEPNFAGTGGTFDETLFVPGVYTIRATTTDSDTNVAFDEIQVTVLGPDVNFTAPEENADVATTDVQVTWSATNMNYGGTTPEHFHLWVNPADPNNLVAEDRISTASFPGQLFWDLTAEDGIVEGPNKVIIIAADNGHLEFLNAEARDEVNFTVLGDTTNPIAVCQDITVELDATGSVSIAAADVDGGSSDTEGIASLAIDVETFTGADLGANTVTLTVTDTNNNTATCTATVTVVDNLAPVAVCQDITVQLDASGNGSITAAAIDGGSSDNVSIDDLTVDISDFNVNNVGANTVTLTVTDASGNSATCAATVTVEDNVAPTAICQNIEVALDANGIANITAAEIDNGSNDASGIASLSVSPSTFDCANTVGENTVTLTVTDNNGKTATCTAIVTVIDDTPPVLVDCPGNRLITSPTAQILELTPPTATDACGVNTVIGTRSDGLALIDAYQVGTVTTVTWMATDNNGVVGTCQTIVTITAPVSSGKEITGFDVAGQVGNESINSGAGTIALTVSAGTPVTALAPTIAISNAANISPASGAVRDFSNPQTYTVTAEDNTTKEWTVTISVAPDTEDPVVTCPQNIVVGNDPGECGAVVDFTATASDNLPGVSLSYSVASGSLFDVGTTTVMVTATDANNNTAECSFEVKVDDVNPPVPQTEPADLTLQCASDVPAPVELTAIDNCEGEITVSPQVTLTPSSLNEQVWVRTWTFTDGSGNSSSVSQTITVLDDTAPVVSCPGDQTELGDINGDFVIPDYTGLAIAIDNCDGETEVTQDPLPGTLISGTTTVTITSVDITENSGSCTFNVTVIPETLASLTIAPSTIAENLLQEETTTVNYVVESDDASTLPTPAAMAIIDNATNEVATWATTTSAANQGTSYEVNLNATGLTPGTYTAILTAGPVTGYTNASIPITLIVEPPLSNAALIVLDATTDTPLFALTNGLQISKATIGNTPLGVIFNTSLNPGGVQFTLTGPITESRTEGPAPHSLFGDIGVNIQGKPFPVGNYTLVADPNVGPTITVNFSVTNVNPLCTNFNASISGVTNPSTCSGVGNATAVPSGGASPFTYQWDNGEITATANNLSVGPHSVIVRDANGCSKTLTFNITGPSLPIVTLAPFANVLNTAAAFALTGGSPVGGTYSGPGVTGSTFNPAIGVGTYAITYTYTDSNGCANSATRNITVTTQTSNAALIVLDATTDTPLFALTNGLQISKATIGNTPLGVIFNTSLNPGGVQFTLTGPITESRTEGPAPHSLFGDIGVNIQGKPFPVGNYTLVADPNVGPTITVNFSVTNVNPLCTNFNASISGVTNPSTCSGVGNATAVPSGGASPFTYQWDNGEITATANNLSVGPHSVIVRDANGCSKTLTFNITGPSLPIVTLAPFANVLNTAAAFALTGGSPVGGTYSGPGVTGSTFNPAIEVGTYAITYTYTDSNGCANSATRNITVTTQTSNAALIVLDATTDTPLFALTNGLQISKATIGNTPLGIVYNPSLNPGGIRFVLTGPITESRTEGASAPYSLFGDIGVDVQGKVFPVGNYTLVANPNSGPTITVNFSVVNNGSTNKSTLATNTPLNEMSIAPNPASEMINMSFDEPVLIEEILIFDVTGRLIKTIREPLGLNSKSIDFNVYDLPIGTYFIKTIDSKGTQYQQQMLIDRY